MIKIPYIIRARTILTLILILGCAQIFPQNINLRVHDPVMIRQNDSFYLFSTGRGISVYSSADMVEWKALEPVFPTPPQWALEAVDGFRGHIWAPDISLHNGIYYLYYSISAFGKNTSCIGLATNTTLDPEEPDFKWEDHGKVIESVPGRDLWNAIDPNMVFDETGTGWLTFGSFWRGMKLFRLNEALDGPAVPQEWYTVASRPRGNRTDDKIAGEAAIEAPFIFKKNGYYYLFVSWDYCCRGIESSYKIMVGRSEKVNGPYLDKNNRDMKFGGGSLIMEGNEDWPGVGHNSAYSFDGVDYLICHGYDASDNGSSKLLIRKLGWDKEGWPIISQKNE
jgi:arabinan endo-1,5-alpha-L-arabinosidase